MLPESQTPYFSVLITVFDRVDLLRACVASVLSQDFADFEIVVGNDNPDRYLSAALLSAEDPRIRIINRTGNLGEFGNMSDLLSHASGRYVTWLADDDAWRQDMLSTVWAVLEVHGKLQTVTAFTGFSLWSQRDIIGSAESDNTTEYSSRGWLRRLGQGLLPIIGTGGFFRRDRLLAAGGLYDLAGTGGHALFTEYYLQLVAGCVGNVVFVDTPLILYCEHSDSWGGINVDCERYQTAGRRLVRKCLEALSQMEKSEPLAAGVFLTFSRLVIWENLLCRGRTGVPRRLRTAFALSDNFAEQLASYRLLPVASYQKTRLKLYMSATALCVRHWAWSLRPMIKRLLGTH